MNKLLLLLLLPFALHAQPIHVTVEESGAKVFEFFTYDAKKAKPTSKAQLASEIAPIIPIYLTTDTNQTPIKLQGATFGTNQLYSYGTSSFNFDTFKSVDKDLNRVVKQKFAVNFRSPVGLIPGDSKGGVVHVHFDKPVTYFGAWFQCRVYDGIGATAQVDRLQFVVNGEVVEYNHDEVFDSFIPKFFGVSDVNGFTDLDIVPLGNGIDSTDTTAYILDRPQFK